MKVDIAGIAAAVIVLGMVSIVGAAIGFFALILIKTVEYRSTNCDVLGAGMTETEIAVCMFLGAAVLVIFFLRELGKGNIR